MFFFYEGFSITMTLERVQANDNGLPDTKKSEHQQTNGTSKRSQKPEGLNIVFNFGC